MKTLLYRIWVRMGITTYWILHPLLALYLNKDERTRVLVWHDGKVLLVKSWLDPGGWYLPGGGLHKSENPAAGAARELLEETGIGPVELNKLGNYRFNYGLVNYRFHGFECALTLKPVLKLQKHEIFETIWLSRAEALQLPLHPTFKQMINRSKMV